MKECCASTGPVLGIPDVVPATSGRFRAVWGIFRGWIGMSGAYLAFASCPCCGQVGCPVGLLVAGVFGAMIAGALRVINRR